MSWSTSLLRMKPPCVVKPLHLCSPKAPRSRKRRRDSCFHNLNGYGLGTELVQEVVATIGNADVELGNASLLLLPVLRILDHPGQLAPHPGFLVCNTAVGVQRGIELTIRERRKGGNPQVDANGGCRRMHRFWDGYLNLESHVTVVALPGDGDVFDRAYHLTVSPEGDPAYLGQVDLTAIHFEALGIAEAISQELLAVLRGRGPTCEEVCIRTLQVDKALLQTFGIGIFEPAVFCALLHPGHQRPGIVVVEPWHTSKVAMFIDRQNLVPDKATRPSILDELLPARFRRFHAIFKAHASWHWRLRPSLLVFDVAPDGRFRDVPDAANVVASAPQRRQLGTQMPEFLPQDARGIPLELCRKFGRGNAWITLDKQVHVIRHDFHRMQRGSKFSGFAVQQGLQALSTRTHQHRFTVFRAEHEVVLEGEDCASVACVPVMFHTTSITQCSMNNNYLTRGEGKGCCPARATSHSPVSSSRQSPARELYGHIVSEMPPEVIPQKLRATINFPAAQNLEVVMVQDKHP